MSVKIIVCNPMDLIEIPFGTVLAMIIYVYYIGYILYLIENP